MRVKDLPVDAYQAAESTVAFRLFADQDIPTLTVPEQIAAKLGDRILASVMLAGARIGEVTAVDNSAGAITQTADVKFYSNYATLGVVSVVVGAPSSDPRDALVPAKPVPTPIPTVTVTATPSPTASSQG